VPWCDPCSQYYTPNSLTPEGACPTCGEDLSKQKEIEAPEKVPWHFWLLLAAATIYLGWRLIQGIGWLAGKF
jgi:hypothetical protein